MGNITTTKHKHSLICVFILQSDAERPDPGRVSPLLLLPSQHKQELTILAGTAGSLHCRRTGESPSNDRKEVHSFRYCSHALIWVWRRSRFWWCLKPPTTETVQLTASHDPILNVWFHLHVSIIAAQWLQILLRIRKFPTSSFVPKVGYPDSEVCKFLQLLYTYSGIIPQIRLGLIKYNPAICGYKESDYWQSP